jgi:hypothetical protein
MVRGGVVMAIIGILLAGCGVTTPTGGQTGPLVTSESTPTRTVELTASQSTGELPAPSVPHPHLIRLGVVAVTNPSDQALALEVSVTAKANEYASPDRPAVRVGQVGLYPSNRPTGLELIVASEAASVLAGSDAWIRIDLASSTGEPLRPTVRMVCSVTVIGG